MAGSVRWGILATGWIAEQFVKDLNQHGHKVTAVGSRSQQSADKFAAEFGIPKAHGSYEALCADPDVDAIYVATPHPMHADNARLALNHGKHVLIEKAFTVNAREAQEIVDLGASKDLVVLEAMWTRFLPHMLRIREIVRSGVLGEIRSVVADHTQDLSDDPKHRLNALELGGGALLDLGIYPISFTFDVLGAPKTIAATARLKQTGADGTVATMFTYGSGAIALTLSGSDTAGRNIATIHGTEGRIEIDKVWYTPTSFRRYDASNSVVEEYVSKVEGRGMQYQAAELERLVAEKRTAGTILSPSESVAIMTCLDTIRQQIGLKYPTE
ncbi:Gfo/Idh/MocA family oxidoreductase [Devosia sp. LjRoot16]|uniref:Gfo/Idh/MocA family protein n=1 Tax=Devosia sp. LjRoot16 TaxID=3342271 RepID=UPI003ED11631